MKGSLSYQVDQTITLRANYRDLWAATATMYNDVVKSASEEAVPYDDFGSFDFSVLECTIAGFISTGEGKFPSSGFSNQVIINDFS